MKNNKDNKILFVVSHPDDELIGCGGTLIKHIKNNDRVNVLILSTGITSRSNYENKDIVNLTQQAKKVQEFLNYNTLNFEKFEDQRFDKYNFLDVTKKIEYYINKIKPTIVYTHFYNDLNLDHRITFNAVMTACRPIVSTCCIYCFETFSSSEWNNPYLSRFAPNFYNILSEDIMKKKLNALKIYENEIKDYPHPRSLLNIENMAKTRGCEINVQYAESFKTIRCINL